MWGALEAEEEVIKANGSMGTETVAHSGEVNGAMMFVDLNGVATAEGDVGAAFSSEVREDALAANGATGVWGSGVDLAALVCPEVVTEDGATHEVGLVREEFECFGSLNGGGQVDGRGEDPGGVAGFLMVLAGVLEGLDVGTKPSVRVSRNATRSFSSVLVKPRSPMVIFSLFGSSGGGQQFTFSIVPGRHWPLTNASG